MNNERMYARFNSRDRQVSSPAQRLPVSHDEWEYRARQILPDGPFGYISGGAGTEDTMRSNREAFFEWNIRPRKLRDVSTRDLTVSLFDQTFPAPFLLAPIGVQEIAHPDADLGSAKAAAESGIPFILSTHSSYSIEDVAAVLGDTPRWFQLYWPKDRDIMVSFVQRAEKAGYSAIVVTLDLPEQGWRERDIRNGYSPSKAGLGTANFMSDPVFRSKLRQSPEIDMQAAIAFFLDIFNEPTLTWNDLAYLRKHTNLPILLKGILDPRDAELALQYGANGIIVSNHGGRQLNGEIASLKALPKISEAVQGRMPILLDSGIRGGSDIIKALALGASAVFLGRTYIYGLAVAGAAGVKQVISNFIKDIDISMTNAGVKSIADIDRSLLQHVSE
ncbi:alpha-hydroxy-acid oxidizing protein [Bacillus sp. ISL-51]|uniref:alpha-hydroxy-acid oxidizing protein n=1 Tax=Bacteria TaxID=2 RepID=UPI001BEC3DA1|nr:MULTISPECIES: alpha-hydroxy-acid oxidizing protein [Bacteria]MBT2575274.1 alpha-hydroxy-acid oxidizing protein [Bacillus sp. ISL-51]MBT2712909.1 alpha-hydroxy-acid oxidizing protein [Pseudomonas sp. ISL-88]